MALVVLTLDEMKAHSALAEVQALTAGTLEPLERQALALVEAEVNRRLTVDAEDVEVVVTGSGLRVLPLPERLDSFTTVAFTYTDPATGVTTTDDITAYVETSANGWLLRAIYPYNYRWSMPVTITGKWGLQAPDQIKDVLMDVIEAMVVRKADSVTHRDELAPWGAVSDGSLRADRDASADRKATSENLLRYDVKKRLRGFYRPDIVDVI